jgi:HEPN domain-containing protein
MNRSDLQILAKIRLREAKVLFDNRCYQGAYYLLGYAVECALKACIAKQTRRYDFPPERKFVDDSYTHDLSKLLFASSLEPEYRKEITGNPNLELNWLIVKDWSEKSRYAGVISRAKSKELRSAVVSRNTGVFPWIQKYW